ncbi:GWxTD domain-containing protein [Bacteroidota bacterium]
MISCGVNKQITSNPVAQNPQFRSNSSLLSNTGSSVLHPDFSIYHNSSETSQLNFRIYFRELRFNTANKQNVNQSRIKLHYQLYPSYEDLNIIDSASHIIDVIPQEGAKFFIGTLNIPTEKGQDYLLKVAVQDILSGSSGLAYIYVDKRSDLNSQNFKIYSSDEMTQLFNSDLHRYQNLNIQYNKMPENKITVDQYITPIPIPKPPYYTDTIPNFQFTPDYSYSISFRELQNFKCEEGELYFFRIDSTGSDGILTGFFGQKYPEINTLKQMIGPIKYIGTEEDYLKILNATNKKLAIDNFWLKISGSTDMARELIRIYYNRCLFANYYFTDISEGWKSDRGMIYMIFGNPEKITRMNSEEIWSYKKTPESENPVFHFNKTENYYSNNVFLLIRDEKYRNVWEKAIESWRRGKAFSFSK